MHGPFPHTYKAFLSYSHADTKMAVWLHKRLEGFPLTGLTGRATALGPVPKQLRPIFRDREDFSAGSNFNAETVSKLDASAALILLCSPDSAKSKAVNEEVRLFRHRHPDRPLIPLILAGKPYNSAQECFPQALKFELDAEGQITDRLGAMPIAADIREAGDGRELALAKVVASLIGVPSDEVYRRAERERRRQGRIRNAVAAVILLLALGGGYLGWRSHTQEQTLADIEAIVNELAPIGSAQAQQQGQRESLTAAIKSIAQGASLDPRQARAYELLKQGKPQDAEPLLRAVAEDKKARIAADRKQTAEAYRNLGAIAGLADPKRAREYYAEAVKLDPEDRESLYWEGWLNLVAGHLAAADEALNALLKLAAAAGDERGVYRAEMRLGELDRQRGNLTAARERQKRALAIAERRAQAAPQDIEAQRDLSLSFSKLGDVFRNQGAGQDTLKAYRDSLAISERLAKANPANAELQYDLSVMLLNVSDAKRRGDRALGLSELQQAQEINERLVRAAPGNANWQRTLAMSSLRVGEMLRDQGNLSEALKSFRESLAIEKRLAEADPDNIGLQSDLLVAHSHVGPVLTRQGNLPEALSTYREMLAIAERLAKADPANAVWQSELRSAYNRVGNVLRDQGNLTEALAASRDSLSLAERLAKADPANAALQSDLSDAHRNVGLVLHDQGNLTEALKFYRESLAIRDRLAKADPNNALQQRRLSHAYQSVGDLLKAQGNLTEALQSYRDALAIRDKLAKADTDNAARQHDLADSNHEAGGVLAAQGNLTEALQSYRDALVIRDKLAKADPTNAGRQTDLSESYFEIGGMLAAQGNLTEALKYFRDCLAIQDSLAKDAETLESQKQGKPGSKTASALGNYADRALFARQFDAALAASERALGLAPDQLWIANNRAHALMFLGRAEEARVAYLGQKGQAEREKAIFKDFADFEKCGLTHPQMAEIRALLAPSPPALQ